MSNVSRAVKAGGSDPYTSSIALSTLGVVPAGRVVTVVAPATNVKGMRIQSFSMQFMIAGQFIYVMVGTAEPATDKTLGCIAVGRVDSTGHTLHAPLDLDVPAGYGLYIRGEGLNIGSTMNGEVVVKIF